MKRFVGNLARIPQARGPPPDASSFFFPLDDVPLLAPLSPRSGSDCERGAEDRTKATKYAITPFNYRSLLSPPGFPPASAVLLSPCRFGSQLFPSRP